jgi:8-oxo-dGTP pyrophosphatase MutT (NUDIX family)
MADSALPLVAYITRRGPNSIRCASVLDVLPVPLRRLAYRSAHRTLRLYWFVRRPPLRGVKCVLTDGDRVLLVRHTYGEREWDLPGGGLRRAESPLGAARREMAEELGVRPEWKPLADVPATIHHRSGTVHCFQADLHEPNLSLDGGEIAAAKWFPSDELPENLSRWVQPILAQLARTGRA